MQSRMDKYNANKTQVKTRTEKNRDLYEDVRNSALSEFDVNSNESIIDNEADIIDVNKIQKMLDKRYNDSQPKRRSIEIPEYDDTIIVEEPIADTKEYDINAIIAKAKQGKNIDYNKERLKKVREAQYEILNNLDLEIKKVEDTKSENRKQEEAHLMDLINTITQIEIQNKKYHTQEISEALDLLSDLKDDETEEDATDTNVLETMQEPEANKSPDVEKTEEYQEVKLIVEEPTDIDDDESSNQSPEKTKEEHIEETLSKLNINMSSYDEFSDISKNDTGALILKIIIFAIIVSLVVGGLYIIDSILELGLF